MSVAGQAFFAPGSATLDSQAIATLDEFVGKIRGSNLETVLAIGHSDSGGSDAYNQLLAVKRSEAVKAYLVGKGIEKNRVYTEGKGAKQPVADSKTTQGRAKNNRVEVEVVATRARGDKPTTAVGWKPDALVPVLFATNRLRTGSDNPYYFYGNQMTDLPSGENIRRGIVVVKVPPTRARGSIERASWIRMTFERMADTPAGSRILGGYTAANPDTEFGYAGKIEELTSKAYLATLNEAVKKSKSKTAVLYVHGYMNDFTDATFRTAQIAFDLATLTYDIVPLMFSWPSDPGLVAGYQEARTRSQAAGYDLAKFLSEIAAGTDINTVHIVAHSMGAEVLGHALLKLGTPGLEAKGVDGKSRPVFRQIVFAAPDVTPTIFENEIEPAIKTNHRITAYGTRTDFALWVSSWKNGQPREGQANATGRLPACVDTIDVSAVSSGTLRHSTWAESPQVLDDLRYLLQDNLRPAARGLAERRMMDRSIWTMSAKPIKPPGKQTPDLSSAGTNQPCIPK